MTNWNAFFRLHSDLPREGPGNDDATLKALKMLPPLPASPRVLDVGCGPGRQTMVLARTLRTPIVAVDNHEPFLAQLRASAENEGLNHLIVPRLGRMEALDEKPGTVDLIWAEGSIFIVGFAEGPRLWRPLLRGNGVVVISELTWLTDDPPDEVATYFRNEYPPMTSMNGNIESAIDAGYDLLDHFVLPRQAWWDQYLTPITHRMEELNPEAEQDEALAAVLAETERELDICTRFGDAFGYVFYLLRKRADRAEPATPG